ncbi:trimeric intracellular cation channel family protein [Aestuariirhabdus litorea]|uniref:Trimeric intracellular cation channel family protein n=1 Tax=Aestuariirhabdus litorea TaxID=2528527 RepID=A0A3P3VPE9_9GAMM|nr:trimeric intracellular cation channel family protein [Aestuariirhabdus litorea]RRJ84237.1 trimeric intracellular cation channel family protein [Aestuariirhabdus litorea]RWW97459.1 trimeric intracellular cation channel family protein [Endozoicomonadaceae bacterium GTF-13]
MLYWLDLFGTIVFAISGCLIAGRRRMDLFGVMVVSLATAIGGGTFRDLILGATPVFWVRDPIYIQLSLLTSLLVFWSARRINVDLYGLKYADALGLAVFTIIGTQKALSYGSGPTIAIMMGIMTGVMGGMIRDLLCAQVPMVLRREIYAAASLMGAAVYLGLLALPIPVELSMLLSALVTLSIRVLAIRRNLSLPTFRFHN